MYARTQEVHDAIMARHNEQFASHDDTDCAMYQVVKSGQSPNAQYSVIFLYPHVWKKFDGKQWGTHSTQLVYVPNKMKMCNKPQFN